MATEIRGDSAAQDAVLAFPCLVAGLRQDSARELDSPGGLHVLFSLDRSSNPYVLVTLTLQSGLRDRRSEDGISVAF